MMLDEQAAGRLAALAVVACLSAHASATTQRTFVSGKGVDNPACSLVSPCRSFGAALSATSAGGEVIVQDSAGYGVVTIAKSVTITAPPGIYAGISVFAGTGITVAGTFVDVTLRGLTINGQGGDYGIRFTVGSSLIVDRCTISGMNAAGVYLDSAAGASATLSHVVLDRDTNGLWIASNIDASISDSRVSYSSNSAIQDFPATGGGTLHVDRTLMDHNFHGVEFTTSGAPGGAQLIVHLSETQIIDSGTDGIWASSGAGTLMLVYVSDCRVTHSALAGIRAYDPQSLFVLANNVINVNGSGGVSNAGGVYTMKNNTIRDNFGGNVIGSPLTPLGFD